MFNVIDRAPVVGQTVIAYNVPGAESYAGKQCVVTRADSISVNGEFQSLQKPDDTINLTFSEWSPVFAVGDRVLINDSASANFHLKNAVIDRPDGLRSSFWWVKSDDGMHNGLFHERYMDWVPPTESTVPEIVLGRDEVRVPADAGPDELRAIIERLSNDLAEKKMQYTSVSDSLATRDKQFMDSIDIISERLLSEAENRGWCSEYDDIVQDINSALPLYEMETREREYTVSWTETYVIRVDRSETYTAKNPEEAEDQARDEFEANTEEVIQEVRNGNYERSDDSWSIDYEVEAV